MAILMPEERRYEVINQPCPFCQAGPGVSLYRKKSPVISWFLRCERCGEEGAKHTTPEKAIEEWYKTEDDYGTESETGEAAAGPDPREPDPEGS